MLTTAPVSSAESCRLCGVSWETSPGVPDPSGWLCASCFMVEKSRDPDVRYFLETVERQIPATERGGQRAYHHTLEEWAAAVKTIRKIPDMRRFFDGCVRWHTGPSIPREYSRQVALDNIGCVMNECGVWMRFKWWLACRLKKSNTFHK